MRRTGMCSILILPLTIACSGDPAGAGNGRPDPGPGPFFSVSPLPIETIARITALGFNNKILPTAHTYWETCDGWPGPRLDRPCILERQPLRAPGSGVVIDVDASPDGALTVEGPPGLIWGFGHVTPAPGLARGSAIAAGDVVATMFYEHGFDFGVIHYGVHHRHIVPERHSDHSKHGQHPIAQFPEPLRSELRSLMLHEGPGLGRLAYDSLGTASGLWVAEGTGPVYITLHHDPLLLWIGRWTEKPALRIVIFGTLWDGMENRLLVADPAAPAWEDIRASSGPVPIRLWNQALDLGPNYDWPAGTLLLEVISDLALRVQWFATHDPVTAFTADSKQFER